MADDVVLPPTSLFEALAESAPDAILTVDSSSTILSANSAVRRIFGREPADLIGQSLLVLIPERLHKRHLEGMTRYVATGTKRLKWTGGTRLSGLRADGTEIPIEVSFGEFVDARGQRLFSGFIRDVSEQVESQRRLDIARADLNLHAQMLAAVEQAIISTDPSGTVLTWNRHAETVYGWTEAQALGKKLRELLDPASEFVNDDNVSFKQLYAGERVAYQREIRRSDGERRWVSVVAAPMFDDTGTVSRFVGISVDITDRIALQKQLQEAQKLDAVGRLAGGVAHDFNNLLTVIVANTELAAASLPAGSDAAADLAEVSKAAMRGATLSKQLLTFSRREPVETSKLDVNTVVADVAGMLKRVIGEDIAIQVRASPDTPAVIANHGQLEQAVTNLVINARDAMPLGGTVTIETRCVRAHEIPSAVSGSRDRGVVPATYAGIIVRDTGHGMAESVRARVFEPFFTTKAPGKGTGLGLATVYGIVKGAGGVVDVSSTVGEGSTFTIYIPASSQAG